MSLHSDLNKGADFYRFGLFSAFLGRMHWNLEGRLLFTLNLWRNIFEVVSKIFYDKCSSCFIESGRILGKRKIQL